MDSAQPSAVTPSKSKLARAFAKVLHVRAGSEVAPFDGFHHTKSKNRVALEALLAKIFASVSSIKAAYAELQLAQFPYDVDGIQTCDLLVVAELKVISELKHCYLKKQLDASPEASLLSAEIKEQKCVTKAYKIMGKKMESSLKMKVSQITLLSEKLEETKRENRSLEKTLNSSGQLSTLDNFQLSGLNASHFIPVLRHAARSIRSFVKVMVNEMQLARWDLYAAEKKNGLRQRLFFERFNELQSSRAKDYLVQNPKSTFSKFCRAKYLKIVHPKMESSFFGNLEQRNLISSGKFPSTHFFVSFMEMAKRVWLLHCLAFSFDPAGSIFGVERGCRFSEVHMESLADEAFITSSVVNKEPIVGFTVVPGFKIGKTVIQSQVYLSRP